MSFILSRNHRFVGVGVLFILCCAVGWDARAQLTVPEDIDIAKPRPVPVPAPAPAQQEAPAGVPDVGGARMEDPSASAGTTEPRGDGAPMQSRTSISSDNGSRSEMTVRFPSEVRAGEGVSVEVSVMSPDDLPRVGTIALSFIGGSPSVPERKGVYDVFQPGAGAKLAVFRRDGEVWRLGSRGDSITPQVPHAELYDPQWPSGTERRLRVPVVFEEAGRATLLVRASFSRKTQGEVVVECNVPSESDALDEQGLPCLALPVTVREGLR